MKTSSPFTAWEPNRDRKSKTRNERLWIVLAVCAGFAFAGLAGLRTSEAAPLYKFVTPGGIGVLCSQAEPCSLKTALSLALDGVSIYVAGGTYTGAGTEVISVTKSIMLYGGWNGAGGPVVRDPDVYKSILDGQGLRRVVYVSGDITPTLDGFTIANGNATGLTVGCDEYKPDGCGGGVYVQTGHPILSNNIITNNVAALSTAGYPTGTTGYGGGIYLRQAARANIYNNLIFGNVGGKANCGSGGGMYLSRSAGSDMTGARVASNRVYSNTATTTNLGCAWGGGIAGGPDGVTIEGNTIFGNQANGAGGGQGAGLYQWYGSAPYIGNLIAGNLGSASSEAIYLGYSGSLFDSNRVVDNFTADGLTLVNGSGLSVTLVNNLLAHSGGKTLVPEGDVSQPLTAVLLHNTLVGSGSGYGAYTESGYVTLLITNTLVTSYTWGITNTVPASSTVSVDHALFWNNIHDGIRGVNPVDGNPALAVDRYHLSPGSAAINAGANTWLTYDIDGQVRPIGDGNDIGADEAALWWLHLPLILR